MAPRRTEVVARVVSRLERVAIAVLRGLDRLLQLVLPARPDRVCYQSIPDYTDNAYYLYRHALLHREGLEHVWLTRDPELTARIQREFDELLADRPGHGHRLRVVAKQSVGGYLRYLTSRTVFHTHGVYVFSQTSRRREVVAVWHGMPIKAIARLNAATANEKPTFATASIATSQVYRYIMATAFGLDARAVAVTGQPRCDALRFPDARGTSDAQIRRRLGVAADRRLVLWMPTYRESGQRSFLDDLPPWGPVALREAAEATGCEIVVKLHPFDVLNRSDPSAALDGIRVLRSDEWQAEGIQLYDLVAASDGLLSDVSSILIDYLVTPRPIGMFAFDEERYERATLLPFSLFSGSDRFHRLDGPDALHGFLRDVRDRRHREVPVTDFTVALHDEVPGPSSEAILTAVGL